MRTAAPFVLLLLLVLGGWSCDAHADTVGQIVAQHRHGQTFISWAAPPGSGWTYRVYTLTVPITDATLPFAALLGEVGDSTWCDLRLSRITGVFHRYAIDSAGTPLTSSQGLFVATADREGAAYYAVTAQAPGGTEDRTLVPGVNTLVEAVDERLAAPRPVYQRTVMREGRPIEVYTLWTSPRETPFFGAMANRAGLAFDCGIVRGSPGGALMIRPHPYGQNFLLVASGSGEPGEWRLTLDDPISTNDHHSWWYGYNTGYDVTSASNAQPSSATVVDYTFRRVRFTVEWARRTFPVDEERIYASGYSMGGIGSLWLGLLEPNLLAAVYAELPRFDFSSMNDPNPANLWNEGGTFRRQGDRLWGTVSANLPSSEQQPVYDRLDMRRLAAKLEGPGMPPIIAFCGKNDAVLGWAEKIPFFAEMAARRHGGTFFWDMRTHTSPGAWDPMRGARSLYRFRRDRSYPALSRCSADSDPGNGTAASGDSVGAINAFVEWDSTLTDRFDEWEVTLRLRDLNTSFSIVPAPDSVTVDVSPRRLQRMEIMQGCPYTYSITRLSDGATVRRGALQCDTAGVLTVPGVTVQRSGTLLRISRVQPLSVSEPRSLPQPRLTIHGNPVRGSATIECTLPNTAPATVDLIDVSGRVVRSLFEGPGSARPLVLKLDAASLPSGVYFVVARQGHARQSRRVVVTN